MKGIISIGCSIAKGWGLWFYNPNMDENASIISKLKYGSHLRYTDLVAKYFNTFYVMDDLYEHSGDDLKSLDFANQVLFNNGYYKPKDFSTIIFQLSWPMRSYLMYKGTKLGPYGEDDDPNHLREIGLDPIEYYKLLRLHILDEVESLFKKCENLGINPILINGSSEYGDLMNDYLRDKLLHIKVDKNQSKNYSIDYLLTNNYDGKSMTIQTPQGIDSHPSAEFHQIIANNIITRIEPPLNDRELTQ